MPRPPHDSWVQGNDSGEYTTPVDKFLIHTTEGSSIAGAVAAYKANNSWPHLTVDCQIGVDPHITGHLDLNVPARSLKNMLGGVQTNRDGVIQIEVVGSATKPGQIDWVFVGEKVLGPICRTMGIPIQATVAWVSYPDSYGLRASQRLTASQWTDYKGVLGHQHAPENEHGDPGAIPIELVLDAANQGDDDLPYTKTEIINMVAAGVQKAIVKGGPSEESMEARVAEGVKAAASVSMGEDGLAAAQLRARAKEGAVQAINLALEDQAVQDKIKALIVEAVAPAAPTP